MFFVKNAIKTRFSVNLALIELGFDLVFENPYRILLIKDGFDRREHIIEMFLADDGDGYIKSYRVKYEENPKKTRKEAVVLSLKEAQLCVRIMKRKGW